MLNSIDAMPDIKKNSMKFDKDATIIYSENNYSGAKYESAHKQIMTDISV